VHPPDPGYTRYRELHCNFDNAPADAVSLVLGDIVSIADATMPRLISVPAGTTSTSFNLQVATVAEQTTLIVTASLNSASVSFTISLRPPSGPGAPSLVWPPNGSTSQGTSLTLQWRPVSGVSQYLVYFGANSSNLPLHATLNAPAVSVAVYNLSGGTAYFWKVVVIVGANSVSGGIWSFTTPGGSQTLLAPAAAWPVNGETGLATSLTAQWSPAVGATHYQIYRGRSLAVWLCMQRCTRQQSTKPFAI